jgi:Protein of unknown function (DUF3179)
VFRVVFGVLILLGLVKAQWKRKWWPALGLIILGGVAYVVNFEMAAGQMFKPVRTLKMVNSAANAVDTNRLIIGIKMNDEARAYPIRFLGYHHFVTDSIGGKPVLVTYCTVCRSGRVFDPTVNGNVEQFRLVGMDHFNAMIEDATTHSWWRQATGEAVAGKRTGTQLTEVISLQTTLGMWLRLHPQSLVMQADPRFEDKYDTTLNYEEGRSRIRLTGTDSLSWHNKSWVAGIAFGPDAMAFDWIALRKERVIHATVGIQPVLLVLAPDNRSFFAHKRSSPDQTFTLVQDTLVTNEFRYGLSGQSYDGQPPLQPIPAYQEFWHSWRTFHPNTGRYPDPVIPK